MPTTDIIGYLWSNRQDLDLDGIPDVLQLVSDLQRSGLDCIQVEDAKIFGIVTGSVVQLVRHEPEEWAPLVEKAIMDAAVERTVDMLHSHGERDEA